MKILFATNNEAQKSFYESGLKISNVDIECLNLSDIKDKVKFEVRVDGINSTNIYEKRAVEYSRASNFITISVDESLYIEGVSDENQPGRSIRRVKSFNENGTYTTKKATDNEVVKYYADIIKKLGGRAKAKWISKVYVAYKGKTIKDFTMENPIEFTSNASKIINKGFPLDSLTLIPEFGDIHFSECTKEETTFLHELKNKKLFNEIIATIESIEEGEK